MKKDIPIFKCFTANNNFYCYDTYTNKVLAISRQHYDELNELQKRGISEYVKQHSSSEASFDIILMLEKGYFKSNCIETIVHPESQYVSDICMRGIYDMTLQVTRDCNFRCRYCSFAREHKMDRTHENVYMQWDIAKKSIDFLFEHSKDSDTIYLSFYGGEPLLNYDIIEKSVKYSESLFETKNVEFYMTTNASLITDRMLDFFVEHKFNLLISLDGPKEYQDNHRKIYENGNNTFDIVMRNVNKIMLHNDYFYSHVKFSSVLLKDESRDKLFDFFKQLGVNSNQIDYTYASMNGVDYIESPYLKQKNDIKPNSKNKYDIYGDDESSLVFVEKMKKVLSEKSIFPSKWHHSGPCIPSITRIFVNVFGEFLPCEKIIESSISKIGNLNNGLDINRILNHMNIGKISEERCKKCWASRFCNICVMKCIDLETDTISDAVKENICNYQKINIENYLKYYVTNKTM